MTVTERELSPPDLRALLARVGDVRREKIGVSMATGLALVIGLIVATLTAEMLFDWLVELPWLARALVLAGLAGGVGFLVWRFALIPLFKKTNDDAAALMIEKALPIFRSRFIASIQLARTPEISSPVLVRALVAETTALATTQDFSSVVKTHRLTRATQAATVILILAFALAYFGGKATWPLLQRAFLSRVELPRKTQFAAITGDRSVGVGDDLRIEMTAAGVLPQQGKLILKRGGGATNDFPLLHESPKDHPRQYSRLIQNVQESFTYTARLGDATSQTFRVTAVPRPTIAKLDCQQTYPSYTKLGTVRRAPGDLSLLAGSRLQLKIRASVPIKSASLRLTGGAGELPMKINPADPRELTGELSIRSNTLRGFSIHLVETHGVESKDTATYRIDVIPDKPPTVRITYPDRHEELVTQTGALLIAFEASDDFGVAHARLHYIVNQDAGGTEKTVELDLGGKTFKNLSRRYEWKMTALRPPPPEGSVIEYWLEVSDNNDVTGPGIGVSERYQVKLVTELEKRADLANRLNDTLSSLNQITQDEEQLNQALGVLIFAKPVK